jgi:hypothetical protein
MKKTFDLALTGLVPRAEALYASKCGLTLACQDKKRAKSNTIKTGITRNISLVRLDL